MQDSEMILSLLRDRFDGIERRLDQQRGALEASADAQNRMTIALEKHDGRLKRVEGWIKQRRHIAERGEDASHQRKGRVATLASGLIGAGAMWALSVATGMH